MKKGASILALPFLFILFVWCYDPTICAEYKINILRIFAENMLLNLCSELLYSQDGDLLPVYLFEAVEVDASILR